MEIQKEQWESIAAQYGTPTYVFDAMGLKKKVEWIRSKLPAGTKLCFAMKANPFLAGTIGAIADRLEVCSPGEYEICIRENIAPEKIVVSGVNKTQESMDRIMEYSHGAGIYTIESELHYEILKNCAENRQCRLQVLIRLSSGNQFGMDQETLERVISRIQQDDLVDLVGIHFYSGTQKKAQKVSAELKMLAEYGTHLKAQYGLSKLTLEYGPGLMVSYFENNSAAEIEAADGDAQLSMLCEQLEQCTSYDEYSIEMGRFLAWDCGYYLTRIMDVKHTEDTSFLIVDGGIHQLNYYGQMMGMKKPYMQILKGTDSVCRAESADGEKWTICGSLCTVNDVIVRQAEMEPLQVGDVVLFKRCGAYAVTEGMALFLSRELPQVLLLDADQQIRVLRPQTEINILNGKMEETKG